jgi:hypothetical protein
MRNVRTRIDAAGRPVMVGLAVSLVAGAIGAAGCGLIAGVDFGAVQPRGSGGAGSSGTESTSNTGGASATGSTGDSSSGNGTGTGGSGGSGPDAPCDPAETPLATGLFVSPSGDGMTGDGSAAAPFKTIAAAMVAAAGKGGVIYLDQGTYAEAVAFTGLVASGVTIDGSWLRSNSIWLRRCGERDKTVIAAPSAVAMTVVDAGTKSGLSNLTLRTKAAGASAADQDGESTIGIFAQGTGTFALFNVEVRAGDAGQGGEPPATLPVVQNPGCSSQPPACSAVAPSGTGSVGGAGNPGTAGIFGPGGYAPGQATKGLPGGPGANGSAGGNGTTLSDCTEDCAGLNTCDAAIITSVTSEAGFCGCGGPGGIAGKPGHAGGASIGVLALGAYEVTIDYALIVASHGGAGSDGAVGSAGGQSTLGAAGADASCHTGGCAGSMMLCHFADQNSGPTVIPGGVAGSPGTPGGLGGKGGGGAGGPSYSVVGAGGGTAHVLATSKLTAAGGGAGQSGAPAGATALQFKAP